MKRSGGVTAAAVVLIVGSSFLVLMAGMMGLLPLVPQPANEQNPFGMGFFYFEAVFILAIAGWGIATAVGILRLRNWARISILVISGLAIVISFFSILMTFLLIPIISQEAKLPPGAASIIELSELIIFGIPLGIAIWWMVLFNLRSVRAQFVKGVQSAVVQPIDAVRAPLAAMAEPSGNSARKIPVSIVVIAVFLLFGALSVGLTASLTVHTHVPFLLFGWLVTGAKAMAAVIVMGAIQLIIGIALLRKKPWSLDATMAYAIIATLNVLLFLASSSRDAYFQLVFQSYQTPTNLSPDFFPHMMHTFMPLLMWFTVAANLAGLYFLWTRREAYRTACAAKA